MRLYLGMPKIKGPSILCLGIFDGVHIGHRAIINCALKLREKELSPVIIYTFDQRPAEVLRNAPADLLSSHFQKARILTRMGVDAMCIDRFDQQTAQIEPEDWLKNLCESFHPEHIYTGYNYSFGRLGRGNNQLLKEMEEVYGYQSHVMPEIVNAAQDVSSTRIRNKILDGDIVNANFLLTYPYTMILRFQKEVAGKLCFDWTGKNVKPPAGKYSILLKYRRAGEIKSIRTVLHIEDKPYIKRRRASLSLQTNEKAAISFAHRL